MRGPRQSLESRRAVELMDGGMSVVEASARTGMDPSTLYKLRKAKAKLNIRKLSKKRLTAKAE